MSLTGVHNACNTCGIGWPGKACYFATAIILLIIVYSLGSVAHGAGAHQKKEQSAEKCRKCHKAIYQDWEASAHSRASISSDFLFQTQVPGLARCQHCHLPEPVLTERGGNQGLPEIRRVFSKEGVNCLSCHYMPGGIKSLDNLGQGQLDEAICGRCHQRVFQEMQNQPQVSAYYSCAKCHMPEVKGRPYQHWLPLPFGGKSKHYSHQFELPSLDSAPNLVGLKLTSDSTSTSSLQVNIEVKNFLPHSLPCNEYGYDKVLMRIGLIDDSDQIIEEKEVSFHRALNTQVPPLGIKTVVVHFDHLNNEPSIVDVSLYHHGGWPQGQERLLTKTRLPLSLKGEKEQ